MTEPSPDAVLDEARALAAKAREAIASAQTLDELAAVRAALVGKQGSVKAVKKSIAGLPLERRPEIGAAVNRELGAVESWIDARRADLEASLGTGPGDPTFDATLPGNRPETGSLHPVTILLDDVRAIFRRLGFDEVSGPEVEDAWHNFDALNIPAGHPARSPQDQFYVEGGRLLRSQTSTVQIRVMESREPPLRVIAPGRVYRPETMDATHLYAFHQVEGLMVGEDVTFADLKSCLVSAIRSSFGADVEYRFRPSYFPFTEVSAELDVRVPDRGWMEVLGCGMVHPDVFRRVGYDPERWTGFAFGMGVERFAMRRWSLPDIRLLEENDVRVLSQLR